MPLLLLSLALCLLFFEAADAQETLSAIIAPGTKIEKIADGFRFTEGPAWHPRGFLVFSDITANTIYRLDPKTKRVAVFRQPSGHANGNLFDLQNRLITC